MSSSHDIKATSVCNGRLAFRPFRTRLPRWLMFLLCAATFATIMLFSRHFAKPMLDFHSPSPPKNNAAKPVVFALIMFSENSAKEGAILLKSAIMYTTRPLQFHILCDRRAIAYLEPRFHLLTHPLHPITVRFYLLTPQSMLDRIDREGSLSTGHAAGISVLMKLFLHEVLPDDVEKAIYVDTDAFFLTDPALLWEEFSHWKPDIAFSTPYHHPNMIQSFWLNASELSSCIMLLHLQKLRSIRLMDSTFYRRDRSGLYPPAFTPPLFKALFGPPGPHGYHAKLGDQTFWWAVVSKYPDIFQPLSYGWEVGSCLLDKYLTGFGSDAATREEEEKAMIHQGDTPSKEIVLPRPVILPKLVHFDCLGALVHHTWPNWSDPESSLVKSWKPAVDYHVSFEWLWLNRGRAESPVKMQVVFEPLFADQRFALEHPNELQVD